jgi:hypothetical protein
MEIDPITIFPIVRLYVRLAILSKQVEIERIKNIKFSV